MKLRLLFLSVLFFTSSVALAQFRPQPRFNSLPAPTPLPDREKIPIEDLVPTLQAEAFTGVARIGGLTVVPVGFEVSLAKEFVEAEGPLTVVIPDLYLAEIEGLIGLSPSAGVPLMEVLAQFSYLAFRAQNLKFNENEDPTGYRFTISASSGGKFEREKHSDASEHYLLNVHVIGPRAEIEGLVNGHSFKATFGISLDYVVVSAVAVEPYLQSQNPGAPIHLGNQSRYQGQGHTKYVSFEYEGKVFSVGGSISSSHFNADTFDNISLDRLFYGVEVRDIHLHKQLWLEVNLRRHWSLELGAELFTFKGSVQPTFEYREKGKRIYAKIKFRL